MVRIWAKTILEHKITRSIIYEAEENFNKKRFHDYVVGACYILDIPTPVITAHNINNFFNFNITRFKSTDFVDAVDFDMLVLEYAAE